MKIFREAFQKKATWKSTLNHFTIERCFSNVKIVRKAFQNKATWKSTLNQFMIERSRSNVNIVRKVSFRSYIEQNNKLHKIIYFNAGKSQRRQSLLRVTSGGLRQSVVVRRRGDYGQFFLPIMAVTHTHIFVVCCNIAAAAEAVMAKRLLSKLLPTSFSQDESGQWT